ncbi:hypothetical protein VPNG_05434 [Cytospora leucostoma]|uniref:Ecp2 effector protein domain-containing protein n=1 Tax=Cytospora leucostoma TaxID=1230097 RepID=A0A423XBP7_9PEZI|nr:hypothetical protein VPNG_05434 [Cytospora leucostoma]
MLPHRRAQAATAAALLALPTSVPSVSAYHSKFNACPALCDGPPETWTSYNEVQRLDACQQHMLVDFPLQDPLGDPSTTVKIRACTSDETGAADLESTDLGTLSRRDEFNSTSLCDSDASSSTVSLDVSTSGEASDFTWATADALALISNYLSVSCDLKQTFSYSTGSIVGVFSGAAIDNGGTVPSVMAEVIAIVNDTAGPGAPEQMVVQRCVEEGSSSHIFGIAIDNNSSFTWVQQAVEAWSNGTCVNVTSDFASSTIDDTEFYEYTHPAAARPNTTSADKSTTTASSSSTSSTSLGMKSCVIPGAKMTAIWVPVALSYLILHS